MVYILIPSLNDSRNLCMTTPKRALELLYKQLCLYTNKAENILVPKIRDEAKKKMNGPSLV